MMIDRHQSIEDLMNRGAYLRSLREMALADEAEREKENLLEAEMNMLDVKVQPLESSSIVNMQFLEVNNPKEKKIVDASLTTGNTSSDRSLFNTDDKVDYLPKSNLRVLRYESYLAHQRYSDDYKHSNIAIIDFQLAGSGKKVLVEQQRSLGKGGLLWDAGVMLAEHVISDADTWQVKDRPTKIVELGAGIGFAGLAVAKALSNTEVNITDLPELMPLIQRNISRNFTSSDILNEDEIKVSDFKDRGEAAADIPICKDSGFSELSEDDLLALYEAATSADIERIKQSNSVVNASVLRWGVKEDYKEEYDVVMGGDVIVDFYCPRSLAETIHDLCGSNSHVYISCKTRMDEPIAIFDKAMRSLFSVVTKVKPLSRRRNEQVLIYYATGKI